jgi:hypothetical protein
MGLYIGACLCISTEDQQAARREQTEPARQADTGSVAAPIRGPLNQQEPGNQTEQPGESAPCWHCFPMDSNDWLVVVGFLTLAVIVYQAVQSRKAAEAGRDSAEAAKTSADTLVFLNRAELDIKNWKVRMTPTPGAQHLRSPPPTVRVTFDITNVGKTAARIDHILVCIQQETGMKPFRRQSIEQDAVIDTEQAFPVETDSFAVHPGADFTFSVWGRILFSDMTGTRQRWKRFGRVCSGQIGGEPEISMINLKGFNSAGVWAEDTENDQHDDYEPQDWDKRRERDAGLS